MKLSISNEVHEVTDDQLAKIKEILEPKGAWKPKLEETFWTVNDGGIVVAKCYDSIDPSHRFAIATGNSFRTGAEAEKYKLRLLSMKPKFLPKKGEEYVVVGGSGSISTYLWNDDKMDWFCYYSGRTFRTEAEANDWYKTYSPAWVGK